jgi:hypothetical protein
MKYGYARVSTGDQNPALQLDALFRAGSRVHDVHVHEADIGETEYGDFPIAGVNRAGRGVDAQELPGGLLKCQRDQVFRVPAA